MFLMTSWDLSGWVMKNILLQTLLECECTVMVRGISRDQEVEVLFGMEKEKVVGMERRGRAWYCRLLFQ